MGADIYMKLIRILKQLYFRSGWHDVYNFKEEGAKARSALLLATIMQAAVGGLSGGIFYTGLLVGYGINIVNISIIKVVPYIASLASLFTPYILERFQKRKTILTAARIGYYVINILGITLLPQLVHSDSGRIFGLVVIVFASHLVNFLFTSGYSAWHMPYIKPQVRNAYFTSTTMVSNLSSSIVLIVASIVTDRLQGDAQLNLIIVLRYVSFAVALLDVYFLQVPKEPVYQVTSSKPNLLDIIRLPISNKKFFLTEVIYGLYCLIGNVASSVLNTWLLEDVHSSYLYINIINALYLFFILGTSKLWSRFSQKHGTFNSLALVLLLFVPTYVLWGFVNAGNYIWLMTIVRLSQHCLGMLQTFAANNLIYVNMPEADQTNYISFHTIMGNLCVFAGMMIGTTLVAAMGTNTWSFFGYPISSVPTLLMIQGIGWGLLGLFVLAIRKKVEPDKVR